MLETEKLTLVGELLDELQLFFWCYRDAIRTVWYGAEQVVKL